MSCFPDQKTTLEYNNIHPASDFTYNSLDRLLPQQLPTGLKWFIQCANVDWSENVALYLCEVRRNEANSQGRCCRVRGSNSKFRIFRNTSLKKVRLPFKRDHVHEVEWILRVILFGPAIGPAKSNEKSIGNEFDISAHVRSVHTNQCYGNGVYSNVSTGLQPESNHSGATYHI